MLDGPTKSEATMARAKSAIAISVRLPTIFFALANIISFLCLCCSSLIDFSMGVLSFKNRPRQAFSSIIPFSTRCSHTYKMM
jgi:hypothetical protein